MCLAGRIDLFHEIIRGNKDSISKVRIRIVRISLALVANPISLYVSILVMTSCFPQDLTACLAVSCRKVVYSTFEVFFRTSERRTPTFYQYTVMKVHWKVIVRNRKGRLSSGTLVVIEFDSAAKPESPLHHIDDIEDDNRIRESNWIHAIHFGETLTPLHRVE